MAELAKKGHGSASAAELERLEERDAQVKQLRVESEAMRKYFKWASISAYDSTTCFGHFMLGGKGVTMEKLEQSEDEQESCPEGSIAPSPADSAAPCTFPQSSTILTSPSRRTSRFFRLESFR